MAGAAGSAAQGAIPAQEQQAASSAAQGAIPAQERDAIPLNSCSGARCHTTQLQDHAVLADKLAAALVYAICPRVFARNPRVDVPECLHGSIEHVVAVMHLVLP